MSRDEEGRGLPSWLVWVLIVLAVVLAYTFLPSDRERHERTPVPSPSARR